MRCFQGGRGRGGRNCYAEAVKGGGGDGVARFGVGCWGGDDGERWEVWDAGPEWNAARPGADVVEALLASAILVHTGTARPTSYCRK